MTEATPQVPETIGYAIPHETIADAMREDGFLPPKMPEWKIESHQVPDTARLAAHVDPVSGVDVSVYYHPIDETWGMYLHANAGYVKADGVESAVALLLPQMLTKLEEVLPILRAMKRGMEEAK